MKIIKISLLLCLLAGLMPSCKKDYTCTCENIDSTGSTSTSAIDLTGLTKGKARDFCNDLNGTFSYYDIVTGYPFSVTKSCKLE
jgi:hypothetical protein